MQRCRWRTVSDSCRGFKRNAVVIRAAAAVSASTAFRMLQNDGCPGGRKAGMRTQVPIATSRRSWLRIAMRCALIVLALGLVRGCKKSSRESSNANSGTTPAARKDDGAAQRGEQAPAAADPAQASPPVEEQPQPPAPPDPFRSASRIQTLADVQQGWVCITRQSRTGEVSTAEGRYQPAGEFTIATANVEEFTLDRAPLAVRSADRLIMHIDGQNLVVFPREHEHGLLT